MPSYFNVSFSDTLTLSFRKKQDKLNQNIVQIYYRHYSNFQYKIPIPMHEGSYNT